ncbi:hypothetical protein EPH_0069320 [Eimeria praecox]|uniref:Uncharacterized protein n=1 Tax=Eimeria praecox TaxID=51316 RepID=U6H633_9EIME|nr:hypothetical protein EPH_0069320 [Eimeria praecox]
MYGHNMGGGHLSLLRGRGEEAERVSVHDHGEIEGQRYVLYIISTSCRNAAIWMSLRFNRPSAVPPDLTTSCHDSPPSLPFLLPLRQCSPLLAGSQMSLTGYRPLQYRTAASFPLGPWGRVYLQGAPVCTCEKLLEGLERPATASPRVLCVARATALKAQQVEKLLGMSHFVLLLLPPAGAPMNAAAAEEIKQIEKLLLDRNSASAVAFSRETKDTTALLERLNKDDEYEHAPARTRMLRPFLTAHCALTKELQPIPPVKGTTLTVGLLHLCLHAPASVCR